MFQFPPHRSIVSIVLSLILTFIGATTYATPVSLDALTSKDAASGLRAALSQGIDLAVTQLGTNDGFLKDPKVTIPLPPSLQKAERALRTLGMGGDADKLKTTMNHAAEAAVAQAKPVFKQALQKMTVADAKAILTVARMPVHNTFGARPAHCWLPNSSPSSRARRKSYGSPHSTINMREKRADLNLITAQDANLNDYVTAKALDGLFSRIADEERAIRKNPTQEASSLIKKVFGAVR